MAKDFSKMEHSNRSSNLNIHQVCDPAKRQTLQLAAWLGLLGSLSPLAAHAKPSRIGFKAMPIGLGDFIELPADYVATVLAPWGDAVGIAGNMPVYKPDASNTAQEQAVQMGMHHDGLVFFPLQGSSTHGLLAINHEYIDEGLLFADGFESMSADKVLKAQNAHGIDGSGCWSCVDAHRRRPPRHTRLGHFEQLREQHDALGHLLVRRRKLGGLFCGR